MNLRPDPIIQIDLTRHLPDLQASLSVPAPAVEEPTALQTAAAAIALGAMAALGLFLAFAL